MHDFRHELSRPLHDYYQLRDDMHVQLMVSYSTGTLSLTLSPLPTSSPEGSAVIHTCCPQQEVTSMTARPEATSSSRHCPPLARCNHCNRIAPANPSAPPTPLTSPAYPFQCLCADFFITKAAHTWS